MCCIALYVTSKDASGPSTLLRPMANAMRHRGPDDEGYFEEPGVGLAMRRLSIVDLVCSRQPISSEDGTIHVIFNGEIYNYIELRAGLEERGHRLSTRGDTETLVHLYEEHGVGMLRFLRGMFAFALWDSRKKMLLLARDRLGKKPLNYTISEDALYFSSELAPLLDQKLASWEIDPNALAAYLIFGFVSAPQTIVRQIKKLPPAHYLVWRAGEVKVQRYWSFVQSEKIICSYEEGLNLVRDKLDESIRLRLRSDVAVGLLLSGGLDSNALLARLVCGLGQKVQAFTIGFTEKEYDESEIARASTKHFGVEHHLLAGNTDLLKLLPDVVRHYGEPSADKSALPTMLLCDLTSRYVKVALSGDGGDEAFAGYPKQWLRKWQHHVSGLFPLDWRERWTLDSMNGGVWESTEPLPYSLLTKLDIASMARSLEVRSPFLDQELVELCAKLPRHWKVNGKQGKRMLRDLVAPDLPPE